MSHDAVCLQPFPLARVEAKSSILCHSRSMLGKHHHVGIWDSPFRVTYSLMIQADGPEQKADVTVSGRSIRNLADRTSKDHGNTRHRACFAARPANQPLLSLMQPGAKNHIRLIK